MHPDIISALQQLDKENKAPTLALLRTRTAGRFSMPQLIAALKQWKTNPAIVKAQVDQTESAAPSLQQQIDDLKAQVHSLQKEVEQLKKS